MLTSPRTSLMPRACPKPQGPAVLDLMVGLASALPFASAAAQTAPAAHPDGSPADVPGSETITVKGQRTSTELAKLPAQAQNTPASISVLTKQLLAQQNACRTNHAGRRSAMALQYTLHVWANEAIYLWEPNGPCSGSPSP